MRLNKTNLILSFKMYQEGARGDTWRKVHEVGSNRRNAYSDYNNVHWPCLANTSFLAVN